MTVQKLIKELQKIEKKHGSKTLVGINLEQLRGISTMYQIKHLNNVKIEADVTDVNTNKTSIFAVLNT